MVNLIYILYNFITSIEEAVPLCKIQSASQTKGNAVNKIVILQTVNTTGSTEAAVHGRSPSTSLQFL